MKIREIISFLRKGHYMVLSCIFLILCFFTLLRCQVYPKNEGFVLDFNECKCDSTIVPDYETFHFDKDSNMIYLTKKEPFVFYIGIDDKTIKINGEKYFSFICGSEKNGDFGFVRFDHNRIFYKADREKKDEMFIDFKAKVGTEWSIENGVFADYKIIMDSIFEDKKYGETIYKYKFVYMGPKVSHGYYYSKLFVSEKSGFLKLAFTNKVNCITTNGRQLNQY